MYSSKSDKGIKSNKLFSYNEKEYTTEAKRPIISHISPFASQFDFLGKDSIRYENTVVVEPLVYKAIGQFQAGELWTLHCIYHRLFFP